MEQMHPFNWDFKGPGAEKYGQYFWGILLNDGRYIYVHADKAVITNTGDLMMMRMRNYKLTRVEEKLRDNLLENMKAYHEYNNYENIPWYVKYSDQHEKIVSKEDEFVMEPNLVLSSGNWVAYFGANVMTGDPVCLDNAFKYDGKPE
jgi:hypothetical protein